MKKPETDRDLVDLIVDTLGNGEEHYILGSWESFVKKRKQRKKLILWFWTTGFAASVLIGWLGFRFFTADQVIINSYSTLNQQIANSKGIEVKNDRSGQNHQSIAVTNIKPVAEKSDRPVNRDSITGAGVNNEYIIIASIQTADSNRTEIKTDSVKSELPPNSFTSETGKIISSVQKTDSSVVKPSARYTIAELKQDDKNVIQDIATAKKVRFGVNFSPGVTTTSTVSSFNYSGGLSADFDLSRHFGLSTGLQVEHQNVKSQATDNPSWMPAGQSEAVLLGIDLPVNITWKFLVRKSMCYYVSSGISSVAYLSEKYITTSYTQKMVGVVNMVGGAQTVDYKLENVESTEQKKEDPLNSFDFAGKVNIIFGMEQHLSSKIYLHVEPYVKIPITGLATRELKFTTSGITCKISF